MVELDRTYSYIARAFDAPCLAPEDFAAALSSIVMPLWQRLYHAGVLASVEVLRKVGDIDLQTSPQGVRDWGYFVLLELAADATPEAVLAAEAAEDLERKLGGSEHLGYLSGEVLVRPINAGTAVPLPAQRYAMPPANQCAAIEYIQIPQRHWEEYHRFMHDVMGPVGAKLVEQGHSHRVQIMERAQLLHWDPSLPAWNRVHILWGDFDDAETGFLRQTTEAIRQLFGVEHDVASMLNRTSHYRIKARMSKNLRLESMCLDRARAVVDRPPDNAIAERK